MCCCLAKCGQSLPLHFCLQPGYLRELLPDSAPNHPEKLDSVLDGDVSHSFLLISLLVVVVIIMLLFSPTYHGLGVHIIIYSIYLQNIEAKLFLVADIRQKIIPGLTHWQSPGYFAYYPSNSSTAGFLGEMLISGFSILGFSWITSPAATELEVIVLDWVAKMLNLPEHFLSSGKRNDRILRALWISWSFFFLQNPM